MCTAVIITVSDRCSVGCAEDISGPLAARLLEERGIQIVERFVVPDGRESVAHALEKALATSARLILTCGGTGITPRDLTPEGTAPYLACEIPGLAEKIRRYGEGKAPMATLSRGLVGLSSREKGAALIVNAPGSPGGVRDTIAVIVPMLRHILEQADGGDHSREPNPQSGHQISE